MDYKSQDLVDQMGQFNSTFALISECLKDCSIDFRQNEFNQGDKVCFSDCASTKSLAYKLVVRGLRDPATGGH